MRACERERQRQRGRERAKWAQEKLLRKLLSGAEHHLNGQVCCVCYGTVAAAVVVVVVDSEGDDVQLLSQETFALPRCQVKRAALLPSGKIFTTSRENFDGSALLVVGHDFIIASPATKGCFYISNIGKILGYFGANTIGSNPCLYRWWKECK